MTEAADSLHKAVHRTGACLVRGRTESGEVVAVTRFVFNKTTGATRVLESLLIAPDATEGLEALVAGADLLCGEDAPQLKTWLEQITPIAARKPWVSAKSQIRWGTEELACLATARKTGTAAIANTLVMLLGKAALHGNSSLKEAIEGPLGI